MKKENGLKNSEHNIQQNMENNNNSNSKDSGTEEITDLEPYILNEKNRFITRKFAESVLQKYGIEHRITKLPVFQLSVTHKSYLKSCLNSEKTKLLLGKEISPIEDKNNAMPLRDDSYERLEILGDAVIHMAITDYLYKRYDRENEGFITKLRAKIENEHSLSDLTKRLGLEKYVIISRIIEHNNGRNNNFKILEDIFESFVGALYEETSYEVCKKFMINIIEKEIDLARLICFDTNYKDQILQLYNKNGWKQPKYELIDSGGTTRKVFTVCIRNDHGKIIGSGRGYRKREADQETAKQVLRHYGELKNNMSDSDESELELELELELETGA